MSNQTKLDNVEGDFPKDLDGKSEVTRATYKDHIDCDICTLFTGTQYYTHNMVHLLQLEELYENRIRRTSRYIDTQDCPLTEDINRLDRYKSHLEEIRRQIDTSLDLHNQIIANRLSRQNRRNKLSEQGPWEFTLTYSPKWYDSDEQAQDSMKKAMDKLIRYYKSEIKELHAVGEYTSSGNSHIHCWYHLTSGHKITDKNFKRAYKHWNPRKKLGRGHQGGHHEPIKNTSDFAGYIEKDIDKSWYVIDIPNGDNRQEEDKIQGNSYSDQDRTSSDEEVQTDEEDTNA